MADNVAVTAGAGTDIATDDVAGVHYQINKLAFGPLDTATLVTAAVGFPVAHVGSLAVTGTFWQATQPVSIAGTVTTTGGLTDAQIRATPLPVSGTVTVGNASLAVTGPLTDAQLRLTAVPVSGTFWQATQPVSGTVTVGNASLAVTGTFWQATQPVSGTVTANAGTGTFAISAASLPLPTGAATETTLAALNTKSPALGQAVMNSSVPVAIASNQGAVPITPPTLTKATQGATGFSTQDLKDAGRVIVNAATAIAGVTAVTTEALLSLNISRDGAATAAATSHAVTSGKRWRVLGVAVGMISTSAAVLSARVSLRMNPSGAVTASSPIMFTAPMSQQAAALAQAGNECVIMIPGGIEFSGTMQIGLSHVANAVTGTIWASLIGYEY